MDPLLVKFYSIIYHGCGLVFSLWLIFHSSPGSSLFSWHPVTTAVAVTMLMAQGVVLFDPVFSIFSPPEHKQTSVNRHLIIQLCAALLLCAGFVIIYVNKNLKSKNHFVTWHAYLGLATVVVLPLVTAGGVAANYGLRLSNLLRPYHVKWAHGAAGLLLFTLAAVTAGFGLVSNWAVRSISAPQRLVLGGILASLVIVAWERARHRFLFKIFQIPTASPS